jgi:predicted O-methyltransferase YrrM
MNVFKKLKMFNNLLNNHSNKLRHVEDVYSLELLNKMTESENYIPFTSMSLRPFALAFLLNEILINNRKSIIEFGAGVSTIMMARLAKKNKLPVKIISVEENQDWVNVVKNILVDEGIDAFVEIIYAPVVRRNFKGIENHWYEDEKLKLKLKNNAAFDLVMIDGPTAFNEKLALSRYYAMPFLFENLAKEHVIFLDDVSRNGEKKAMTLWGKDYGKKFNVYAGTLGVCYVGHHYESNPVKFIDVEYFN